MALIQRHGLCIGPRVAAASNIHLQVPFVDSLAGQGVPACGGFAGLSLAMDILQSPSHWLPQPLAGFYTWRHCRIRNSTKTRPRPNCVSSTKCNCGASSCWALAIALLPDLSSIGRQARTAPLGHVVGRARGFDLCRSHPDSEPPFLFLAPTAHGKRLIGHAVIELAWVSLFMVGVLYFEALRPYLWLWLGVFAVAISILMALPLFAMPCNLPVAAIYIGV